MSSESVSQSTPNKFTPVENASLDKLSEFMDQSAIRELVDSYITRAQHHLRKAQQAAQKQDGAALKMALHTLKGSSANLGLTELAQFSADVESHVETGTEWQSISAQLETIERLYQQSCNALRLYLASRY